MPIIELAVEIKDDTQQVEMESVLRKAGFAFITKDHQENLTLEELDKEGYAFLKQPPSTALPFDDVKVSST